MILERVIILTKEIGTNKQKITYSLITGIISFALLLIFCEYYGYFYAQKQLLLFSIWFILSVIAAFIINKIMLYKIKTMKSNKNAVLEQFKDTNT